ncbi:MAG: hypothetical protein HY584_04480, partial [Candidatus Omnitrophica bacterium]|nr:hypothetical protein [Candidatus Omnitrophota bacterium]
MKHLRILFSSLLFSAFLFSHLPTLAHAELENFQAADVVVGQPDFTSAATGTTANRFNTPRGISVANNRLLVADRSNNRVLIWNSIPKTNFSPADVVLGQPNFTSNTSNNGGRSARSISNPDHVHYDGKRIFVTDTSNHRILIWNAVPKENFASADTVVGQSDFASATSGTTAQRLNTPRSAFSDGKRLYIVDVNNDRVLIWFKIPTTNFAPADIVLGQPDFTSSTQNNGGRSARSLSIFGGMSFDGKKLFIGDAGNARILIWNTFPTENFAPADMVLGQPDFSSGAAGITNRQFNFVRETFSDGNRLVATDQSNQRVLIWKQIPTANFAPADIVIGQPNFSSNTANNGGRSGKTLSNPLYSVSDGKRLFVGDTGNHRVLIFNIASGSAINLSPQFEQGKAVLGKVFHDVNGNGIQDQAKSKEHRAKGKKGKAK